ncbi:MAG TPA: single-stranded-DNA-specific exonuclease RecJ [Solirubrobacterales bacterium]
MAENVSAYRADPYDYREARAVAEALRLSEPVAITLVRRGYRTPEQARRFLDAEESHPPGAFASMGAATERILAAIREERRITVHGDFDVDGVCATAVLVGALREVGADCDWLIPDRIADGYGLSEENIRKLAERGTSLIVTVDCGVTSVAEVALARSLGMEVVVTDHHQPGDELPDCPILHPALDDYPFEDLCGTAVAAKLASALRGAAFDGGGWASGAGSPGTPREVAPGDPAPDADLDLVALATVADMVPLVGENRSLVKHGLAEIRRARRPGIRALLDAASCEPTSVDEGDLAFRLAPRINAAGRLYRADAGVELFLTPDRARADQIAAELSRANAERRAAERQVDAAAEAALRLLPDRLREAPGLVLAGEGWHPGVIGIVASRLVERHHRPAGVIALDGEGGGRGSGRSIAGFDLLAGLEACSQHLLRFGGHRAAAGLELRAKDLEAFREAFAAHAAEELGPEDLVRTERIDAIVGGAGLGLDLAEELERLRPFGMGNPGVRLLVPSARVRDVRAIGEGKHARFSLHSGSHRALGVAFGRPSLGVGEEDTVDAAVRLEVNRWNGSVEPQIVLRELYPRSPLRGADEASTTWWRRFEAELERPPADAIEPSSSFSADGPKTGEHSRGRVEVRPLCAPAAVIGELVSSGGGPVLAIVADAGRRAPLAGPGVRLADGFELEAEPELARHHEHVVLVDPPSFGHLEALASLPADAGGYLHRAWGEAEWRFARSMLAEHFARRETLIAFFRDLREEGAASGERLRAALRGQERFRRSPEAAARCFRVLQELGLVQGTPAGGDGEVRVVSSKGTELERSTAFAAYGAHHQEGLRYLERRKQP